MRRHVHRLLALVGSLALAGACGSTTSSSGGDPHATEPTGPSTSGSAAVASTGDPYASLADEVDPEAQRVAREAAKKVAQAARDVRWAALQKKLKKGDADALKKSGDTAMGEQNWRDAYNAYAAIVVHEPGSLPALTAVDSAMRASFALGEYDEGLTLVEDLLLHDGELHDDQLSRARLSRVLANTYLAVPHWGTTKGGVYHRARYDQGEQTESHRADRRRAIVLLEQSRDHYAAHAKSAQPSPALTEERIAANLDLSTAIARFTAFDATWSYWYSAAGNEIDDDKEDAEGSDEHAGEYRGRRGYGGWWGARLQSARPKGLPVTPNGDIIFVTKPAEYAPEIDDTAKIKFLLDESQKLDDSTAKDHAARALLLQALLFRTRDGTERLDRLSQWWWNGTNPYKTDIEAKKLYELGDDEVLGLVATHIASYKVPEDESVPRLLRAVLTRYPSSKSAEEASLLLGTYYQSRQQYPAAIEAFEQHMAKFPSGSTKYTAEHGINDMRRHELAFVETGVQPAGAPVSLKVRSRNVDRVRVKATRIDLEKITADFQNAWREGANGRDAEHILSPESASWAFNSDDQRYTRYLTDETVEWKAALTKNKEMRYVDETFEGPLSKAGLWRLEAIDAATDQRLALGIVLKESMALVTKNSTDGDFTWVVDARSGKPIAGATVEVFSYWSEWSKDKETRHSEREVQKTDENGVVRHKSSRHSNLVFARHQGRVTHPSSMWFSGARGRSGGFDNAQTAVLMTDRPVYRPGDTVKGKIWARVKEKGEWRPSTHAKSMHVWVRDARGNEVLSQTYPTTGFGSVDFEVLTKTGAPLGNWNVQVQVDGSWTTLANASFSVEEYKAPELTVVVNAAGQARLGDVVKAEIAADYLFGGGVANAKVNYKVYREDHEHSFTQPGPWDWLYGRGYGRPYYAYDFFPWWSEWGPRRWVWYPWWGPPPTPPRELVKEGEGRLDVNGRMLVEIDTARAKREMGKTDHRYIVIAEVTDASRRLIKGEGEIVVTRNAFFASIETVNGYSTTASGVELLVSTALPDGTPLVTKGKILVEEVSWTGVNGATLVEKKLAELPLETLKEGAARLSWRAPSTGQFKFTFVTKDDWGTEVRASTVQWVAGPGFSGAKHRFQGLELITDKRVYVPGDTAKVLVNVEQAGASVLLATQVDNGALVDWRVMAMAEKSRVIEIPITAAHVPNFFIEATTVAGAEVFQEAREIFVPPVGSELNVTLSSAKKEYKPGETATVVVKTTNGKGEPVSADVAISIFDAAVLYIRPDGLTNARAHFYGQKRSHHVNATTNLARRFDWYLSLSPPDQNARYQLAAMTQAFFQQAVDFREGALSGTGSGGGGVGGAGLLGKAEAKKAVASNEAPAAAAPMESRADDAAPSRRQAAGPEADMKEKASGDKDGEASSSSSSFSPTVRRAFADTALWAPRVLTNEKGEASVQVTFPDNLTTWKVKAVGLTDATAVGQSDLSLVTTKKLLVRLAAPRFFRERDRVLLSALVHNHYDTPRDVKVSFDVDETLLVPDGKKTAQVTVPAHGEAKLEMFVKAKGEGQARVRVTAAAKDDGDAKELTFPVLVHGMEKVVSATGSVPLGNGTDERSITLSIPKERRDDARLVVRYSPSLAGGMIDALPYLLEYPYGCTEQTLSRFVPAVLTKKALQQSGGVKLEDLAKARAALNAAELNPGGKVDPARVAREHGHFPRNPIYDTALLDDIIATGLARVAKMQHGDGGWGWWTDDRSSAYLTAYAMQALLDARDADLAVDGSMIARGTSALARFADDAIVEMKRYDTWAYDHDAFLLAVLTRAGQKNDELATLLYARRARLSSYGKLLLAVAFHRVGDKQKAEAILKNVEQWKKDDDENETSHIETKTEGWWYWWHDDIETNAAYLRALDTIRPKGKTAPRVVKWLLNHRKHGYYWDSTRDTAQVIAAFANHMQTAGERRTDYDLEILLDGQVVKSLHIDRTNLYTYDAEAVVVGDALGSGDKKLTVRKKGEGAVYFNAYLSYFTLEEDVTKAGLEVKVERTYSRLVRDDRKKTVQGDRGQNVSTTEVAYRREVLTNGAQVESGDLILVELMLESKNEYTHLAFEDPKPAGMEPVALRSGTTYGEAVANLELRDEKVVFFLSTLSEGKLKLSYRLRAEIPGEFHAMPTMGYGMYAPEIRANSDEMRVTIVDASAR
jgi:uncharacterized protein YfaS (alpha-2-macroglobulin family)